MSDFQNNQSFFDNMGELATQLRSSSKKYSLIFAHNGTGKTQLSVAFKNKGRNSSSEEDEKKRDTLYFNAYTEDLFTWDNDLEYETDYYLKFNKQSHFFDGVDGNDMEGKIRPLFHRYVNVNFKIDVENSRISFFKHEDDKKNIKISRGEETVFIWCFFEAILKMVVDEEDRYKWVKFIYVDDPVSSLDDCHVIAIGSFLAQHVKKLNDEKHVVISTHHGLFFNVMFNELKKANKYYLNKSNTNDRLSLVEIRSDTPIFYHLTLINWIQKAVDSGNIYTYHFNFLRNLMEKISAFYGYSNFSDCLKIKDITFDEDLYSRIINIMSHGNYSLYDPVEMSEDNKELFKNFFKTLMNCHKFNEEQLNLLNVGEIRNDD